MLTTENTNVGYGIPSNNTFKTQPNNGSGTKAFISFNEIKKEMNYQSPNRKFPENDSNAPTNPLSRKSVEKIEPKKRLSDIFTPPQTRVIKTENVHETAQLKTYPNIKSYACKSLAGSLDGITAKTNQDGYICAPNFCGNIDQHFFAVLDGHGNLGHDVTDFVKSRILSYLESILKEKEKNGSLTKDDIMQGFAALFKRINSELFTQKEIDISLSGCTVNCIFIAKDKLYCINIGDSRSIITIHKNYEWFVMPLSEDHKPENPREKARIEKAGGKVSCMEDNYGQDVGPMRVWLRDSMIPGLAMSRSIGDKVGRDAGVIADPDISCIELTSEHKFIVLATDGIWEFITNEDALRWIEPYFRKKDVEKAGDFLSREALKNWKKEDEVIDDITCVLVFLSHEY